MSDVSIDQNDPIAVALDAHKAKLAPGSAEQLHKLFASDYAGLPPQAVKDLIAIRLQDAAYTKFVSPEHRPPEAPAPRPTMAEQLRAAAPSLGRNALAGNTKPPTGA